jgi:hypothetical protein
MKGYYMAKTLTAEDFLYIEQNWKRFPLKALANKYQLSEIEFIKILRQRNIVTEIQPIELQYIKDNINGLPANVIQDNLGLTSTQFAQICQKVLKVKRVKSLAEWTLEEAISKTKWLIEEKLQITVDDFLPRKLRISHFMENNLYGCLKVANHYKKNDGYYQHFPAVAFLVCHSYPDIYRPFQFSYSKTNQYFRGQAGRKNLINAIRWVLEKKMGFKIENLAILKDNKYFIRQSDLQFYGVGSHWYVEHFRNKRELISELSKIYKMEEDSSTGHTKYLRQQLINANIPVDKCYIKNCYYNDEYGVEIHHIIQRSFRNMVKVNIHSVENLIPLCPNHHKKAKNYDGKQLLKEPPQKWRDIMADYLSK